uniref:Transmembrane protein 154 n=1 Tax=Sinocyclocheilus grahami TaxID=75366 RepID=A0A672LKI4_SINGR
MNLTLFLLLALTASWTELVQCEDNEEPEEEFVSEDLLGPKAEGEEENSDNHGDSSGDGRSLVADSPESVSTASSDSVNNQETEPTTETNTETNTEPTTETNTDADEEDLSPVIMIIIPLVLTLIIIAVIVCVVMIYRRRRIKAADRKEDPYLDHEDNEKVPM